MLDNAIIFAIIAVQRVVFIQNIAQRYKKHLQRCFYRIDNNNFVELF